MIFFRDTLTQAYGDALQRIAINFYLSCPNRENGGRGCLFCPEDGAQARHLRRRLDIKAQVEAGIEYVQKRYAAKPPYIAYFQSYTNTYAKIDLLKSLYEEALSYADFKIVMISTRPDCLDNSILDYLESLTQRYDIWVELGVQTSHDSSLKIVERGHDFACSMKAIHALHARNIKVVAHLILGLPHETPEMMLQTAHQLKQLPLDGVKFHQMMVFKKTPLAHYYHHNPHAFLIKNEYEYADIVCKMLKIFKDEMIVMRLNADADQEQLLMPHWLMKKGQFREHLLALLNNNPTAQLLQTDDQSFTAYHATYRQHFHCVSGAKTETLIRFITPSGLEDRLKLADIDLLDIGFGLGYNAFESIDVANRLAQHHLSITSIEKEAAVLTLGIQAQADPERKESIRRLEKTGEYQTQYADIKLFFNDARKAILPLHKMYDIIYLDAFSPDVNTELWTYDFLRELYKRLKSGGVLCTYSSAYPVIGALIRCGFKVGKTPILGEKRFGLLAIKADSLPEKIEPLLEKEERIARETLAGVAYRDPTFSNSNKQIKTTRDRIVKKLKLYQVPKWLKM